MSEYISIRVEGTVRIHKSELRGLPVKEVREIVKERFDNNLNTIILETYEEIGERVGTNENK